MYKRIHTHVSYCIDINIYCESFDPEINTAAFIEVALI